MKKLIIVALAVIIAACSPAQKQAETALAADETECAAQCAVTQSLAASQQTAEQVVEFCATKCGADILTNPAEQNALKTIVFGARSVAAARKPDAGQ